MWRAEEAEIGLPRQRDVIGELAGAGQQCRILDPRYVAAASKTSDRRFACHCFSLGLEVLAVCATGVGVGSGTSRSVT
jgi:hypothetical protein